MEVDYFFKKIDELTFKDLFNDCKYPEEALNRINIYIDKMVKNKINNAILGDYVSLEGNYLIGEGTNISSSVTIMGPVIIGRNVLIMPGALIRPYSIIGDDVVVGHNCEIKHSIIMNKAKVQSFTFIGDSIIGFKTRVGSGTILANRRFDQEEVTLKNNNSIKKLGSDFFGSVIGDNTRLGAHATCYPGTFIGSNTWIYPNTVLNGFIESEKRVSIKHELYITDNQKYELN